MLRLSIVRQPPTQGFTLLETIVTTVVVGVIAAIVAPNWLTFINSQRLKQANEQIDAVLRLTQNRARQESQVYSVALRMDNNIPKTTVFRGSGTPSSSATWVNVTDSSNFISMPLAQGSQVTFNIDGSISPSSALQANEKITLSLTGVSNSPQQCVIFKTLLGSIDRDKGSACS